MTFAQYLVLLWLVYMIWIFFFLKSTHITPYNHPEILFSFPPQVGL